MAEYICKNGVLRPVTGIYQDNELPSDYQKVEYIESTGTQCINSYIIGALGDTIQMRIAFLNNSFGRVFGAIYQGSYSESKRFNLSYGIYNALSKNRLEVGMGRDYKNVFFEEELTPQRFYNISVTFSASKQKVMLDGKDYYTDCADTVLPRKNYTIFARHNYNSGAREYAVCKISDFVHYRNDVVIGHFIPCYRKSDEVIGMYDIINKRFLTNIGTGTFKKGRDLGYEISKQYVATSNGLEQVYQNRLVEGVDYERYDWLVSKQKDYINVRNESLKNVDVSVRIEPYKSVYNIIRAIQLNGKEYRFNINTILTSIIRVDLWDGVTTTFSKNVNGYDFNTIVRLTSDDDKVKIFIDGVLMLTIPIVETILDYGVYLCSWPGDTYVKGKFYTGKVKTNNHLLIPCQLLRPISAQLSSDNKPHPQGECGMYDSVSGKFFGNANTTGSFSVYNDPTE